MSFIDDAAHQLCAAKELVLQYSCQKISKIGLFTVYFLFLNACVAALHHPNAWSTKDVKACDEGRLAMAWAKRVTHAKRFGGIRGTRTVSAVGFEIIWCGTVNSQPSTPPFQLYCDDCAGPCRYELRSFSTCCAAGKD